MFDHHHGIGPGRERLSRVHRLYRSPYSFRIIIPFYQSQRQWAGLRRSNCILRAQGKTEEAHQMLEQIYAWFTEGFDTPDLVEARELLESLEKL